MNDDNLPALRHHNTPATTDTDSWVMVVQEVSRLAAVVADTEFVPKGLRGKPAAATAAMLYGREVGLPPMTALASTHVVEGRPGISAEAMRALVLASGHEIEFPESTGALCRARGRRAGRENWTEVVWTLDMARAAGLLGKSNWKSYPRQMLQARATVELCRLIFPDVTHGFRAIEELEDMGGTELPGEPARVGSSTVQRRGRKAAAAKPAAAALPAGRRAAVFDGPPLPGEPGYADPPAADPGPAESAVDADPQDEAEGDGAVDTPDPAPSPDQQPEPVEDEPVDAEIIEDEPEPDEPEARPPRTASRAQLRMIHATFTRWGVGGDEHRERRLAAISRVVGREITTSNDLTATDASTLIDTLGLAGDLEGFDAILAGIEAQ